MSSVHVVVVWEWRRGGAWLPHAAGVARALERAHAKQLTRVVLADAEPALRGHYVNLRTLTQTEHAEDAENARSMCRVRRAVYSVQSPAARGVAWSWAACEPAPPLEPHWEPLPMEVQCRLEEAWARGGEVQWDGWAAAPAPQRMACRHRGGALRVLRRAPAPPYPLARAPAPSPPPPPPPPRPLPPHEGRAARELQHQQSCETAACARSVSPHRKPGLARQLLHNLNIFRDARDTRDTRDVASEGEEPAAGQPDQGGHSGRPRRLSLDTVSTYLSHESKDGDQRASVGSLLNCSAGSDDVFEDAAGAGSGGDCPACRRALPLPAPPPALPAPAAQPPGTMSWRLQPEPLPNCASDQHILVTYNFQSGVQGLCGPAPGAAYYAVGFPRHSLLPACALGRGVLAALRRCWARQLLFAVGVSRTTGREHVVLWRVDPPPAHAAQYRTQSPERLLRAALLRLLSLLPPDAHAHAHSNYTL